MLCAVTYAQVTYQMGSVTSVTTCDAVIYDNGGSSGNYGTGRNDWLTIYPTAGGGAVSILFEEFDVASTDTLYIFNGTDPNNDTVPLLIGSLAVNWVNESNVIQIGDQHAAATIQNPTGALTLHFVSAANSETRAGFKLVVSCEEPCQRLHARIDFANSRPVPHFDTNLNDGYYYMDFCPGDTIHLASIIDYPDNDFSYHQDVSTTFFEWSHGTQGYGRPDLDYVFTPGHGYDLTLSVRDVHNGHTCYGQTPIAVRVRGSQDPFVSARLLNDVCEGAQIPLLVSMDSAATIIVAPVGSIQETSLAVDSTVFIPDGPNCSGMPRCYSSSVNFTVFPPNATIGRAQDILGIRINMEHSFIGDINISIICPNGRTALLMPDHNGVNDGAYFGATIDDSGGCNANAPQGTGWNYCWSENSTYAQLSGYCYNNVGHDAYNTVDSSHVAHGYPGHPGFVQGQQYYQPYQSFSNLIGCPLNGLWQIQVCDEWGIDDGFVYSWELTLDPDLMPQDWTYDVNITGISWDGSNIIPTSDSTSVIICNQPGDFVYTFTLDDDFGCSYPHDMQLKVVQQPDFVIDDQSICIGEETVLDPQFDYVGTPGLIGYNWGPNGETSETLTVTENGEYTLTINTYNNDRSLTCTKSDTAMVVFNPNPIADFSGDNLEHCAPLTVNMSDLTTYSDGQAHTDITLTYQWSIIDQDNQVVLTSSLAEPQFTIQDAGLYHVQLIVTTPSGCIDTMYKPNYLLVKPQPVADFVANPERTNMSEMGEGIRFTNITDVTIFDPSDAITWTWDYGDGNGNDNNVDGLHAYDSWGEYTVTLTIETASGCRSTITHPVYVEADLEFPNVMTPNGDNVNDVFAIRNMNPALPNILSIYDRWGKRVYEKENYQAYCKTGSDEIYNATEGFTAEGLSDGVYYYTFHYDGYTKTVVYHGSLTVIRGTAPEK